MTPDEEAELKRIHGDDVELKPDDRGEDLHEHLEQQDEGQPPIRFAVIPVGRFGIESVVKDNDGNSLDFDNHKDAVNAVHELDDPEAHTIIEYRGQNPPEENTEEPAISFAGGAPVNETTE